MANVLDKIRAAVTGDDAERLAGRREIHKEAARLQVIKQRHDAIGDQIRGLDPRENAAVEAHQKTCAPIQATLQRIEREVAELILADKPISDSLAKERADALDKLATANSKLEAEVEALKKLRRQLETQRKQLAPQFAEISRVRSKLTEFGIANPALITQRFVLDQEYLWTEKRLRAAEKDLRNAQETLGLQRRERESRRGVNSRGEVFHEPVISDHEMRLEREVDNCLAEVEAAEQSLAKCGNAKQEIRNKIVAE